MEIVTSTCFLGLLWQWWSVMWENGCITHNANEILPETAFVRNRKQKIHDIARILATGHLHKLSSLLQAWSSFFLHKIWIINRGTLL